MPSMKQAQESNPLPAESRRNKSNMYEVKTTITNAARNQQLRRSSSMLFTQESSTQIDRGALSSQPSSVNSVFHLEEVSLQSLTTPKVSPFPLQGMIGFVPPLIMMPHHQVHINVANATMNMKIVDVRNTL